jgi:hypothetical protein
LIRALLVTVEKGCRGCSELEEVGGGGVRGCQKSRGDEVAAATWN